MGGDGVNDISAGASEGVGGMENGAAFTSGLLQSQDSVVVAVLWGCRLVSTMSWRRLGGLERRSWVDGPKERIWKPSLRIRLRR